MSKVYAFQTLFEIGETVYYLDSDNVCRSMTVTSVSINYHKDGSKSVYYSGEGANSLRESELFQSLEAVRQHVFGEIEKPSDEEL